MKNNKLRKYSLLIRLLELISIFGIFLVINLQTTSPVSAGVMDSDCGRSGCGGGAGTETNPKEKDPIVQTSDKCPSGNCTQLADGTWVDTGTIIRYPIGNYDYCYVAGGGDCGSTGNTGGEVTVTAGCNVTAPTNITAGPYNNDFTRMIATWIPGSNVGYQEFYMGPDSTEVSNNCSPLVSCVAHGTMPADQTQLILESAISPSTVYAGKIKSIKYSGCEASTDFTYLPSCALIPSNSTAIVNGAPITLTSQINDTATSRDTIDRVTYSVDPNSDGAADISSQTGNHDTTPPYQVEVGGTSLGTVKINSTVTDESNNIICTSDTNVTVVRQPPWWQVIDSDIQANGNLISNMPLNVYFGLAGAGGYPGVPAYTDGTNLTTSNVSQTYGWLAQSSWLNPRLFNYDYFANQIPSDILPNVKSINGTDDLSGAVADPQGYEWYKYNGGAKGGIPLTIDADQDIGSRKVILLVDSANVNINKTINLTDGLGFFLMIVKGNISLDPTLGGATPALEGIYIADGSFSDGSGQAEDDVEMKIRGSVVAYGGVNMQRDLASNISPAEIFEYAPDQILLFPKSLSFRRLSWKEVAP